MQMVMRKFLFAFAVVVAVSCSKEEPQTPVPQVDDDGAFLLDASKASSVSAPVLNLALNLAGYGQYSGLAVAGVDIYTVTYRTQYPAGTTITASGLFFLPENRKAGYPAAVYTHGSLKKPDAPSLCASSLTNYTSEIFLCALMASSQQCAVIMPDYIGYGASQQVAHPYIHKESIARASLDMIRAYGEYAQAFDGRLFITGYSEGGYAAVALQQMIQQTAGTGLRVVKTVAGSGPYDNAAFAAGILSGTEELTAQVISCYLWALGMFKNDYGYAKSYDDIFSEPDNAVLRSAAYTMGYFVPGGLPINRNPQQLFRPAFLSGVLNGTDTPMAAILAQNSLTDFAPGDSLIFVSGSADDFVHPVNTRNAYDAMHARGNKVAMHELPGGDHETTLPYYLNIVLGRMKAL